MTTDAAVAPPRQSSDPAMPVRRWTTAEFDAMVNKGILREGSPTFLWDGEVIEPMAENRAHVNAVSRLGRLLDARFPEAEFTVDWDAPLELRDGYKPQPDLVVLKGPRSRYDAYVPGPEDVVLLVEVSDTTYPADSGVKRAEYAARGIADYWIVNIPDRRVEVYRRGFERNDYALGDTVPVFERDGIPVFDILRNSLRAESGTADA